jgi:hypothetical protein
MAIKGKGRTRTRQPVRRAPRRGPVPVPVPFARRRGVWLTNGFRAERENEADRAAELRRRQAGAAWNDLVKEQIGSIGTFEEGSPPVILPLVGEGLQQIGKSDPPKGLADDLKTAADDGKEAADQVAGFKLVETLRDKGFEQSDVLRFLAARDALLTTIELTRRAALLGVVAADLEGPERAAVLEEAEALLAQAETAVSRFYQEHTEAMSAAGIVQAPSLPVS